MGKLISGKDALIALANGEEVQGTMGCEWVDISIDQKLSIKSFTTGKNDFGDAVFFRLKPRTITLNGSEVPCCGENYQYGDAMYILNSLEPEEYNLVVLDKADEVPAYWWRTEEEIKQVVAALRQVFGG